MMNIRRFLVVCILVLSSLLLSACHENPTQEKLYRKLFDYFEGFGYSCSLQEAEPEQQVPIYKPSAWKKLLLNGEEVLVYFDDSNRADYLSEAIDEDAYGYVTRFGLRFVLVYGGDDAGVLKALNAIENE